MSGDLSPDALAHGVHDSLEAAFRAIPATDNHAVVFDGTTQDGGAVRGLYLQRAAHGWNIALEGEISHAHGVSGKAVLAKSW